MKTQDVIDWCESYFACEYGAPWRWADLEMTKPYQLIEVSFDPKIPELEHRCCSAMITRLQELWTKAGCTRDRKTKLYWRWLQKFRIEDGIMSTRLYLDGNPGYPREKPTTHGGRPFTGQVKLWSAAA